MHEATPSSELKRLQEYYKHYWVTKPDSVQFRWTAKLLWTFLNQLAYAFLVCAPGYDRKFHYRFSSPRRAFKRALLCMKAQAYYDAKFRWAK